MDSDRRRNCDEADGGGFDQETFDDAWFIGVLGESRAKADETAEAPSTAPAVDKPSLLKRVRDVREFLARSGRDPWADCAIRYSPADRPNRNDRREEPCDREKRRRLDPSGEASAS